MNDSCMAQVSTLNFFSEECKSRVCRTSRRWILAEVPGLVAAEETLGLDLGGGTSGEFLVEADDTLHANGIGSRANGLVEMLR